MTIATADTTRPMRSIAPDRYERFLSAGSALLLLAVFVALLRGHDHWRDVPVMVWLHLVTILVALSLTPTMLLRRRGTTLHRRLGRIWVAAMLAAALLSFGVQTSRPGHFSPIHLLSAFTLFAVPAILWTARTHDVARHRRMVRAVVTGALLIAGAFTFPFGRMLGSWLFA